MEFVQVETCLLNLCLNPRTGRHLTSLRLFRVIWGAERPVNASWQGITGSRQQTGGCPAPMRVALVDPVPVHRDLIAGLLEARGHKVTAFIDAGEALEIIRVELDIGALITDSEAKSISGVELCWETRLLAGRQRPIYILLMSPTRNYQTRCEALDAGTDDVIDKPPVPEALYAKLRVAERVLAFQCELMQFASTDPLTGIYNRRAFFEAATEACREPNQSRPVSAILFDIDCFKAINDRCGHAVGDDAVRMIAAAARDKSPRARPGSCADSSPVQI